MKRRAVLTGGVTIALASIAGCTGDGDGDSGSTPTTEPGVEPTTEPGEEPPPGEVAFSVEHSGAEMDWGDEYSVTVTARAGDEPPDVVTVIAYQMGDESTYSHTFDNTEAVWRLDAGKSRTKTFEIEPPAVDEFHVGLFNTVEEEVVEEWDLTVTPPVQSFGETLSYYDGLDVTVDVELHEWLEFDLHWDGRDESGTYPVRPEGGQWVKVNITAYNRNDRGGDGVGVPTVEAFSARAGNSALEHPRWSGADVGADTRFEVDDEDGNRDEERSRLEMRHDGEPQQEGFWFPQDDISPDIVEEGWMVFETGTDTTKEDLQLALERDDITAIWE